MTTTLIISCTSVLVIAKACQNNPKTHQIYTLINTCVKNELLNHFRVGWETTMTQWKDLNRYKQNNTTSKWSSDTVQHFQTHPIPLSGSNLYVTSNDTALLTCPICFQHMYLNTGFKGRLSLLNLPMTSKRVLLFLIYEHIHILVEA